MFSQTHGFPFPQRRVEPLFAEGLAATGQAHAFPVPLCTSCADTGLTAQGSAAIIDLTRDSPRANDCTLQRNKVNTKRGAKVEDSAILPGNKRARGGSARMTVAAALGMVDQETVRIGCIQQKQSAVKTVGLLHTKSRDQIGSDAAQLLARSFMGHPLGMQPPVPSMEIGVDTTQPLHAQIACDGPQVARVPGNSLPAIYSLPCSKTASVSINSY